MLLENGLTLGTPSSTIDKRGGFTAILRNPTNHTGTLHIQGGLIHLQDNGALPSTSVINIAGGELRVDNGNSTNADRVNDAAAINLRGGALRLTGETNIGTVTAIAGTTQIINNPTSETVVTPLTLTGFTRQTGAVVQFQSPDLAGGAVGQTTFASPRVFSRILIPGQANVTGATNTIPGLLGSNNLDFIQYDGTTLDNGVPLGVRDTRNPGSNTLQVPVPYVNDTAETGWTENIVLRSGAAATVTLTANRALDAWKVEQVVTLNQGAFNLRIQNGGILAVGNASTLNGTGALYAGQSVATAGVAELFIGGNNTLNINSIITDNPESGQTVALVKTGTGQLNLGNVSANLYSGGTYVNSGTLNTTVNNAFGAPASPIHLSGGTLLFNIANAATIGDLGVPDHPIIVNANSQITLDNGVVPAVDNDITLGPITINGPYTLRLFSFDSMDASFTGTHTFGGTPTIDMTQAGGGGNGTGFFTITGEISGSGFYVASSGNSNDTTSILQIGAGEATANTYSGKVTVLLGTGSNIANSEDLRVELNKAPGTTAITGDLEINGGTVRNIFDNQIADTSNLVINQGQYDAFGKNETIASVTQRGGNFRTSSPGTGGSTVTVTGDYDISGADDLTGSGDGMAVNSNTTLTIGGTLRMNGFAKGTIGAGGSVLNVGGLEMTGTTLTFNASGTALMRLNGNMTTFASPTVARLGNNTTTSSLQLNGTRTFTVADGAAGIDLSVSTAVVNSTAPVATGGLVKAGPGTLQLEGSGQINAYSGPTAVNDGPVVLFKSAGVNALGDGSATNTLTIGDGVGADKSAQVIVRNSNQIADTTDVTINADGVLDFDTFNTSEIIGNLTGAVGSAITLGPTSSLTVVSTGSTTYSGSIAGDSTLNKNGLGTLYLDGDSELNVWNINVNVGTLNVDSDVNNASVLVDADTAANFGVSQKMTSLIIGDNAVVTLGDLPGPPPAPFAEGGLGEEDAFDDGGAASAGGPVQAVPEPGSISLLLLGALGLLARRRSRQS